MSDQVYPKNVRAKEAGAIIGVSVSTLAKWRMKGDGPAYKKIGRRIVVYRVEELLDWMDARPSFPDINVQG